MIRKTNRTQSKPLQDQYIGNYAGHPMFYEILEELKKLHDIKNAQYATPDNPLANFYRTGQLCKKLFKDSINNKALCMALCYMSKQVDGVMEIVGESKKNTIEELNDKLKDIAVYAILAIILNKEGKEA